ncbi:MAG: MaoC family dehydratase N-terminal domain-containing protein [Myxococcota bacterium]|nr:MaoC family dehydratase N-terminal domain-containing protein [Myxococcota bacterium]
MADHEFPVDRTSILMFAAAIGETNPIYYDEAYARDTPLAGVIAPPTFGVASAHWNPSYGLRGVRQIPPPPPRPEGEGGGGGSLTRVLHGEQRFDYHQPLRAGMRLRVSSRPGESWEKEGRRGGKLRFNETITEYRDESGELVLTATSVGVVTEKAVEQ